MGKTNRFDEVESNRQIKLGALVSYIGIFLNILASLLFTPWMIQQIGQENFGLYALATSLISIFIIDFGLSEAVSRFVSKFNLEGDQESINNFLGITYKIYLIINVIIFLGLILIYFNLDNIYMELSPSELSRFKVIYIISASYCVISFPFITLDGIFTSYEKFIQLKICDLIYKILTVVLITLALLNGYGLYALVTANAISGLITILIKLVLIKCTIPIKVNFKYKNKKMLNNIFEFSVWSAIIGVSQRFIFNITPTVLGAVSGAVSISIFAIANALEGFFYTIAHAINGLFLPKVTRITSKDNSTANLLMLMIKIGRIQLVIIGLVTIGFLAIGKDFIILWVGEDYKVAYYCTILLIIPSLIYLPQEIGNTAIIALNKVKLQAYVFIGMAVLNIILSIIFSSYWGELGASLAICISYFMRSFGLNFIFNKVLKLNMRKFYKECYIQLIIPLVLSLAIGKFVVYLLPTISWSFLILKGILIVIIYIVIMWIIGLNKFEKDLIITTIKRIKK